MLGTITLDPPPAGTGSNGVVSFVGTGPLGMVAFDPQLAGTGIFGTAASDPSPVGT